MEDINEQRDATLLNIIIDLTQRLNKAEADAKKYERWWLDECAIVGELREKLNKAANSENL